MNTRRTQHSQEITSSKPYAYINTVAKTSGKEQDEVKEKPSQISSSTFSKKQDSTSKKTETITIRSVLRVNLDLEDDKPMKKGVRSVKKRKVQPDSAAVEHPQRPDDRMKAKDFPPGLATTISCGLFGSKEPQTAANLLQKMLFVQNIVPPLHLVEKLMDLLKYGPKSEGSSVYFKDPLHTELASSYAYALVEASSRLVREDESVLFGPSSWDDVKVLLSQSIDQTENAMSGRRLAQGLHMAACGAKLLCLMLKTELLKSDFSSSANFSFGTLSMKLMPTVKVLKTKGLRNALKAVVRHTTKCLVRHSKWILDHDLNELSSVERASAECCAAEAKTCFDCLGSVLCYTAWLFCAEEGIGINHPNCAFVIKDAFLSELTRYIEDLPEMSSRKKTTHIKKLKWYFILSFVEEFASSLQDSVGTMIGLEDLLDCFKVETTAMTQTCGDVSDGNLASSCPSQFIRKSNSAVMVLRREAFVEAYELKKQDSGLNWVQYVSDGKCEAVTSEKIFRSRQRLQKAKRKTFDVKDSFNLNQAKSSRYLTGEKLNPLTSNIVQDDLRQMEAYDEACKAFRIRSFLSCNSESMKAAQSDTDLLSPQTILATHSVVGRPPPIPDASDPNPRACASDTLPRPILHPRLNHPEQYGDNYQAFPPSNTSFVRMEKSRRSSPTTSHAYVSPPVSVQQQQSNHWRSP
jgi:hypothetical protein